MGFADLARVPEDARQGLPVAVSIGLVLDRRILAGIRQGPTDEYMGEYTRANELLGEIARQAAEWLLPQGYRAVALAATGGIDMDRLQVPFQHKTAARLAGLGWIGKCAVLVTPDYGAMVRWNTILTDAPLPTAPEVMADQCGDCRVCVDVCPGHAPSGNTWREGMAREEFFDARACLAGTQQITRERGTISRVCGLCVANCPYTLRYLERAE